jgi:1,4-alpha-glucan branching enzyme
MSNVLYPTLLTADDLHYFNEGRFIRMYEKLGAHILSEGVHFAVWAPNAETVSVIGDFNGWDKQQHQLHPIGSSGLWAGIIPQAVRGQAYKYFIKSRYNNYTCEKADPIAFCAEAPPHTASIIWDLDFKWHDDEWMCDRKNRQGPNNPISIYEMHLGSWRRKAEEDNRSLSYQELSRELVDYLIQAGFTHVEFLPVMEHPFRGSWGYQITGYFAPTRRFGDPQDLMHLIDCLHQAGIGVLLDWVPSHFPGDGHGLSFFDGQHLYEHADPRQGYHPDWNSYIYNYGRNEVRGFLISNAMFWLDKYHIDGLRVDAVASMLYLDYSRKNGEWIPNVYGGRENLEALAFLRELNNTVHNAFPEIKMIAEESTSWPMVSRPADAGGLGFDQKWDMGWMHDTLNYFHKDPIYRQYHQNEITFRSLYAFHENFVLSLSHDEVVYGKGSMIEKMAGDEWQKFANLRCLYTYMYGLPGKKLMFMGDEFAQRHEWSHDGGLEWFLLERPFHAGVLKLVSDLNALYKNEKSLQCDFEAAGFEWVDANDTKNSVVSFLRKDYEGGYILCAYNFTPVPHWNYQIGVPRDGFWQEIFNSDATEYGGSGYGRRGGLEAAPLPRHRHPFLLTLSLPPLGGLMLKCQA